MLVFQIFLLFLVFPLVSKKHPYFRESIFLYGRKWYKGSFVVSRLLTESRYTKYNRPLLLVFGDFLKISDNVEIVPVTVSVYLEEGFWVTRGPFSMSIKTHSDGEVVKTVVSAADRELSYRYARQAWIRLCRVNILRTSHRAAAISLPHQGGIEMISQPVR